MKIVTLFALALLAAFALPPSPAQTAAAQASSASCSPIGGRKTVTVYADSESEASSQAASQNPGWTVIGVKKVNPKDPISRMYTVTLEK